MTAVSAAPLRLIAEDASDLEILSAALQDAVVRVGDIEFIAAARTLTLAVDRFRWENEPERPERVRAAVQFGGVLALKSRGVRQDAPDVQVGVLGLNFSPDHEPPGGALRMALSGGGDLLAVMECIDAVLTDLGAPWPDESRALP